MWTSRNARSSILGMTTALIVPAPITRRSKRSVGRSLKKSGKMLTSAPCIAAARMHARKLDVPSARKFMRTTRMRMDAVTCDIVALSQEKYDSERRQQRGSHQELWNAQETQPGHTRLDEPDGDADPGDGGGKAEKINEGIAGIRRHNDRDQQHSKHHQLERGPVDDQSECRTAVIEHHHFVDHRQFQVCVRIIDGHASIFCEQDDEPAHDDQYDRGARLAPGG